MVDRVVAGIASVERNRENVVRELNESETKLVAGWKDVSVAKGLGIDQETVQPVEDSLARLRSLTDDALDCQEEARQNKELANKMLSDIGAAWVEGRKKEWLLNAWADVRDFVTCDTFKKDFLEHMRSVCRAYKGETGAFAKDLDGQQKTVTEEQKLLKQEMMTQLFRQQLAATPTPASQDTAKADDPRLALSTMPAPINPLKECGECETAKYYSDNQGSWFPCVVFGPATDKLNGVCVHVEKIDSEGIKRKELRIIPQERLETHFKCLKACASCEKAKYFSEGDSAMYFSDTFQSWLECIVIQVQSDGAVRVGVKKATKGGYANPYSWGANGEGENHTVERTVPKDRLATHLKAQ